MAKIFGSVRFSLIKSPILKSGSEKALLTRSCFKPVSSGRAHNRTEPKIFVIDVTESAGIVPNRKKLTQTSPQSAPKAPLTPLSLEGFKSGDDPQKGEAPIVGASVVLAVEEGLNPCPCACRSTLEWRLRATRRRPACSRRPRWPTARACCSTRRCSAGYRR